MSSEPSAASTTARLSPITGAHSDPDFRLTLPQLERLYRHFRTMLLREAHDRANGNAQTAESAVQHAFAAAAKTRFSFRSEPAAVLFIRGEVASYIDTNCDSSSLSVITCDWADVLARANIQIAKPAGT